MAADGKRSVFLAEYAVLAAEIANRSRFQQQVQSLAITGSATIFGLAVLQDIFVVVLVVPILCGALGAIWLDHARSIARIGAYISVVTWPALRDLEGDELSSHEDWMRIQDSRRGANLLFVIPSSATFLTPSVVALVVAASTGLPSAGVWLLWVLDVVVAALSGLYWIVYLQNPTVGSYIEHEKDDSEAEVPGALAELGQASGDRSIVPLFAGLSGSRDALKVVHLTAGFTRGGGRELLAASIEWERTAGIDSSWIDLPISTEYERECFLIHQLVHGRDPGCHPVEGWEQLLDVDVSDWQRDLERADLAVFHDPQVLPVADKVSQWVPVIWRSHIGTSYANENSRLGWSAIEPHLAHFSEVAVTDLDYLPATYDGPEKFAWLPFIDHRSVKNTEMPSGHVRDLLTEVGVASDQFVAHIGRWDPLKGADILVNAADAVQEYGAQVLIAGPSPQNSDEVDWLDHLNQLAESHANVRLLDLGGSGTDSNARLVNAIQREAAVVVQCSTEEAFGLAITEAMWKERAVVGTAGTGAQLQIEDGETGFLIPRSPDPAALSTVLSRLLGDPALRDQVGIDAKSSIENRFLANSHLRTLEALLRRQVTIS